MRIFFKSFCSISLSLIIILCVCHCEKPTNPDDGKTPEADPPIANAGPDLTCRVGQYVLLDGTGSKPRDKSRIIWWDWDEVEGNPDHRYCGTAVSEEDSLIPIGFNQEGIYRYTLKVKDEYMESELDTVQINVLPKEQSYFISASLEIHIRWALQIPQNPLSTIDLESLDSLNVAYMVVDKILDLTGIEKCVNLVYLQLGHQSVVDLTPLAFLLKLKYLNLTQHHTITDITPLSSLTELTYLDLMSNQVNDLSPIRFLEKLKYLNIGSNESVTDISPIQNLTQIKHLYMGNIMANSFSCLEELTQLIDLFVPACGITDVTPFRNMTSLIWLDLDFNHVQDISALSNLTNLEWLYLWDNEVLDISACKYMTKLERLRLYGNLIEDIYPLVENQGLGAGDYVGLEENPLNEKSISEYIPILIGRGVSVTF